MEPTQSTNNFSHSTVAKIITIIFLIGGVYFGLTQVEPVPPSDATIYDSKADTANWQIYRNEEYGFEFKYPEWSSIMAQPYEAPYGTDLVFSGEEKGAFGEYYVAVRDEVGRPILWMTIFNSNVQNFDSVEFQNEIKQKTSTGVLATSNLNSIKVYESPAVLETNRINATLYFQNLRNLYVLGYSHSNEYADQILSTFRFLE